MPTRTITDTIRKPDGSAWANVSLSFKLTRFSLTEDGIYPKETVAVTDADGSFSVALATGTIHPDAMFDIRWIVRPNQADATTLVRVGAGRSGLVNPPTHGVYFERLADDTAWFCVCRNGGVETRLTTGVTLTAAVWVTLRIRRIDASTIGFTVGSNTEQTMTTNLPTLSINPFYQIVNGTAASRTIDIDWFSLLITGLAR